MSDPKNKPDQHDRRKWIEGDPTDRSDELSSRAARGREWLDSPEEAADLLGELDELIDAEYAGKEKRRPVESTDPTEAVVRPLETRRGSRRGQLAIAAAVLLLLAVSTWGLNGFLSPSPDRLVTAYFQHFDQDLVSRTMGESAASEEELTAAMAAYDARDYNRAVPLLEAYLAKPQAREEARLYLGVSQLALGRAAAAKDALSTLRRSGYQPDAVNWYTALADLRLGEIEAARRDLLGIAEGSSLFRDRAARLLKEL